MKLLVVEDDQLLRELLENKLTAAGFVVDSSADGEDGLYRLREYQYDLAIIDLGLPKLSGIDLIALLREEGVSIPVLILTARSGWQDKVHGLNAGADDYLTKPFQVEELVARIQAMLRRSSGYSSSELTQGAIKLDMQSQEVTVHTQFIDLTAFEYKLLEYFMLHPKKVVSKAILIDYLYEEYLDRDANVIEVLIGRLRKKIDPDNQLSPIQTLRGRGYRFVAQG